MCDISNLFIHLSILYIYFPSCQSLVHKFFLLLTVCHDSYRSHNILLTDVQYAHPIPLDNVIILENMLYSRCDVVVGGGVVVVVVSIVVVVVVAVVVDVGVVVVVGVVVEVGGVVVVSVVDIHLYSENQ